MKQYQIAVIGAGFTGLILAQRLKEYAQITLFEKSRGVGGRIATRRSETSSFDHGAQYFTARSASFKAWLEPLIHQNIVAHWNAKHALYHNNNILSESWPSDEPRYVGVPSMNALTKHLASTYDIKKNILITKIHKEETWTLYDSENNTYSNFDWVILAIPSHQALNLLDKSLTFYSSLSKVEMSPCFSVMLELNDFVKPAFDCAHIKAHDIAWIALNHTKPGRKNIPSLVIQASPEFSLTHINADRDEVLSKLITAAQDFIEFDFNKITYQAIHLWRYANNYDYTTNEIFIDESKNIAVAGDFCLGGRIEGAFTSANQTVTKIISIIQSNSH